VTIACISAWNEASVGHSARVNAWHSGKYAAENSVPSILEANLPEALVWVVNKSLWGKLPERIDDFDANFSRFPRMPTMHYA